MEIRGKWTVAKILGGFTEDFDSIWQSREEAMQNEDKDTRLMARSIYDFQEKELVIGMELDAEEIKEAKKEGIKQIEGNLYELERVPLVRKGEQLFMAREKGEEEDGEELDELKVEDGFINMFSLLLEPMK